MPLDRSLSSAISERVPTVEDRLVTARQAVKVLQIAFLVDDTEDITTDEGLEALTDRAMVALEQIRALAALPPEILSTPAPEGGTR